MGGYKTSSLFLNFTPLEGKTKMSQKAQRHPADAIWNGLVNRGLIIILTNLLYIKIAQERIKGNRINPASALFPVLLSGNSANVTMDTA